jgi:two-component system cell cycle sensor histidine kinase/response regulator CckA
MATDFTNSDRNRLTEPYSAFSNPPFQFSYPQSVEAPQLLASGIAHDVFNLLTVILGNIGLAKQIVCPDGQVFPFLEEAEKASSQAAQILRQLLGTPNRRPAIIADTAIFTRVIRDAVQFALHGSKVKGEVCLPDDLWVANIGEGPLCQLIQNLVINAAQSMPGGGQVVVRALNLHLGVEEARLFSLTPGDYIEISVVDNGMGIKPEYLGLIFEPHFTTKEHGYGLGLANCKTIVDTCAGSLRVESELGQGTTFHIYLPL